MSSNIGPVVVKFDSLNSAQARVDTLAFMMWCRIRRQMLANEPIDSMFLTFACTAATAALDLKELLFQSVVLTPPSYLSPESVEFFNARVQAEIEGLR